MMDPLLKEGREVFSRVCSGVTTDQGKKKKRLQKLRRSKAVDALMYVSAFWEQNDDSSLIDHSLTLKREDASCFRLSDSLIAWQILNQEALSDFA